MYEQAEDSALIHLDARAVTVAWMMGATKIFGWSAEDMVGHTIERLFTPEDEAAGAREGELEHARGSSRAEDDRWMMRRDGVRFWASGFVHCLRNADGSVAGYAKLLRDRTDLRGQVETLRNRVESFAVQEQRKDVMLGTLAHELRNPLGAITNAVQLVDLAYPDDPKLALPMQILRRQIGFVRALVDDLTEVVRARIGKAELHVEPLYVRDILEDALQTVEAQIHERAQRVYLLLPPSPVAIAGDRVRLQQVFVNLLTNASRFSARGGRIWVKAVNEADEMVVRVADEGQGIAPSLLPHVFDMLSQAPASEPTERDRGLGLGLAIVKEYVELHGGVVQVRSEGIGRGCELTVRLPLPGAAPSA
jgi:two-component system CheB/CheR fusion protein